MPTAADKTSDGRLHGLDAARGVSMALGVFAHSTLAYAPFAATHWPIVDPHQSQIAALIFAVIYCFRVPAFFFLSGYFARLLLSKRDRKLFAANRFKRIVIPLAVAFLPIRLIQHAVTALAGGDARPRAAEAAFEPGHLWFLYYLAIILAAYLLLTVRPRWTTSRTMGRVDRVFRLAASSPSALALSLLLLPSLIQTKGTPTPISFVPNLAILGFYGVFFAGGVMFHRNVGLMTRLADGVTLRLIVAIVAFVGLAAYPTGLIHYYARGVFAWAMTFVFVGVFLKLFSVPRRVTAFLSDSSYWTYLVHPPIVLIFQALLVTLAMPAMLKFSIVSAATLVVCFTTFAVFVRSTALNAYVGGRTKPTSA